MDETTYLFSPKVLDRAFTFEFRTSAAELDPALRRPGTAPAASSEHRAIVAGLAASDDWHHSHPHPEQTDWWTTFGPCTGSSPHRAMNLGIRCSMSRFAMQRCSGAMGLTVDPQVLDRIVLTKLLPKMHGTRSRLEKPLTDLLVFAQALMARRRRSCP